MNRLTKKSNIDYTTNATIHTVGFTVIGDTNKDYSRALKKLYELENIFELIDNLYKFSVCIEFEDGKIITETFNEDYDISYNPRTNEIEVHYYDLVSTFNPDNYKKTWWFKDKDKSE